MRLTLLLLCSVLIPAIFGCGAGDTQEIPVVKATPVLHPLFQTPVSGQSSHRPAVQVDILDASESWFGDAELYLTVQCSRFPQETWVVLPVNVGDFESCRSRFIQLPFEVQPGDNLVLNLLDEDSLTPEDEQRILNGCRVAGYCVVLAGAVYAPQTARLVSPIAEDVSALLGETIVDSLSMSDFENFGTGTFIVPERLPAQPHEANLLTVLDDSSYARVQLKIYGPDTPLDNFSTTASPTEDAGRVAAP